MGISTIIFAASSLRSLSDDIVFNDIIYHSLLLKIIHILHQAMAEKDKTIRLLQSSLKASRHILNVLADILYKANEVFKRAVDAIIHFGTDQYKSVFAPQEAADIRSVMQEYGETTEQQNAVGAWLCDYAESRQPFGESLEGHL